MSKALNKGRNLSKKVSRKVVHHSSPLQTFIPAGMANAKPPLGSQLAQRKINVANFCKEFNQKTAHIKEGVPLPCRVKVKPDGTYDLVINHPPTTFFLKQAAGIQKGKMIPGDIVGKVTFKHIYEIALIKAQDPCLALISLEEICKMVIGSARSCGIQVVHTIDPKEYEEFLKQKEEEVQKYLEELQLTKENKVLRT